MLTTRCTERTRPPLKTNNVLPICHRWSVSSLPLDGHADINMTMRRAGSAFGAMDYYHRECGTNLLWRIIASVDDSKQTDGCHTLSRGSYLAERVRVFVCICVCLCVCVCICISARWEAFQVKCCANFEQVGLMWSPRVLSCWQLIGD